MKKIILTGAMAAAIFSTAALAQTSTAPAPVMPAPSATTTAPSSTATMSPSSPAVLLTRQEMGQITSSKLVGAAVYSTANEKIGDVNDIILDSTGKVAGVVIGVGGFLGVGEKNVGVAFSSVTMSKDEKGYDRLVVNATKDTLKAALPFEPIKAVKSS